MKEYDIFVPLHYNDGSAIELKKMRNLQRTLLNEFEGVTFFPQPNEGHWKLAEVTYQDEIVVYRVLSSKTRKARGFLSKLKEKLKRSLRQEEILIIERDVETL